MDANVWTHVDTPELLHGIKCNDFLEKIIPIIALVKVSTRAKAVLQKMVGATFPLGGLVNQRVHSCIRGCLTLKFSGS